MNAFILAAAVIAPLAQQSASPPAPPAQSTEPAAECAQAEAAAPVQWVGAASKHTPGFVLITDTGAWKRLWASHLGLDGEHGAYDRHLAPHVDFDRYLVIAYFRGPSTNRDGEVLSSITNTRMRPPGPSKLTQLSAADFYAPPALPPLNTILRFESSTFQTESISGSDKGVATTSYGIWLIPIPPGSTPKTMGNQFIIQEGRRSLKNETVTYEEVEVLMPGC